MLETSQSDEGVGLIVLEITDFCSTFGGVINFQKFIKKRELGYNPRRGLGSRILLPR